MKGEDKKWFPALDGLRAIAAYCVLFDHFYPADSAWQHNFHFGRLGVDLFFILSGFLIVGRLLKIAKEAPRASRKQELALFYWRRALRIFPLYYGTILAMVALNYQPVTRELAWHLTYTSNIGSAFGIDFNNLGHFWSLCVEEQFYMFVPALLLFLPKQKSLHALLSLCALGVAAKVLIAVTAHDWNWATRPVTGNLEGLTYGAVLAYAWSGSRFSTKARTVAIGLMVPAAITLAALQIMRAQQGSAVYSNFFYISFVDLAMTLTFGPLVLYLIESKSMLSKAISVAPLRYLGRISYGTYVFHFMLIPFLPFFLSYLGIHVKWPWDTRVSFVGSVAITYVMAAASWHFFESPILRLKHQGVKTSTV